MKKLFLLLAVILIFISCKSIPGKEGSYLQDNLSEHSKNTETLSASEESPELTENSDPAENPADISLMEETAEFPEPTLEFAETNYPTEVPEESSPTVTEEPIAQQPPAPPVLPPTPPVPPPQQITPIEVPQRIDPPIVQQEEPPSESSEPEKEPSVPQRETPSYTIPDMPFQPATVIPDPVEANLPYSRTVRAMVGQFIEIPFRGTGWVYLGEFGSRRGVSYDSRRMDQEGMTFIFRADAEGTYSLRFNRHDFVRDSILNDYVRIIVEQRPPTTGFSWSNTQTGPDRVYAEPRWPLATEPEGNLRPSGSADRPEGQSAQEQTAGTVTTPQASQPTATADTTTDGTPVNATAIETTVPQAEDWLKKAREEYNAGQIKNALGALDQFMILYPAGSDEAFWLYGQSFEANNEATRDIRLSLDYYRRLTQEFPQSNRYNEARQRIAYLERFYFNIQ